jgi:carboxyl-terminal processing protease
MAFEARPAHARSARWCASLVLAATLGVACKDKTPPPDPHSLAALDAEGPPRTSDCRAWDKLGSPDSPKLPPLPAGPHVAAFEQIWRTVADKHYDPTLACLDWPALREQYGARVAEAGDDTAAAYVAINEMLGLLGQSHLHATPPSVTTVRERSSGPATVPITVRWLAIEARSVTSRAVIVDEAVDAHPSGLPRGAILTKVDDESVDEIARATEATLAPGLERRPAELAFATARAIGAMLSCPEGGSKRLSFLDPARADAESELDVACFIPEGERVSLGNIRNLPTTVKGRMLGLDPASDGTATAPEGEARLGYLAFNYWMVPMTERVRTGVDELRAGGMQGLIIDLRGNPGGVGAMSIPIARMFLREGASLGRLQMREFDQEFNIEPNPDAFAGPIVILVDEGTASTSEIFALGLRDIGRVTIVGAGPSAGMALPSMIETLPDGGLIQYVVGDYHSARGTAAEGEGVVPEVLVTESRTDYATGRDPVLDAATELLRERVRDHAAAPAPEPAPAPVGN